MDKQKIIVVVGPTAVGKTSLGVTISEMFDGEVISGDSLQVYKELDIGTAKVTKEEAKGVKHHLIDIKNKEETYSAFDFQQSAKRLLKDMKKRDKLPVIVGGTGLYVQSLLFDFDLGAKEDAPEVLISRKKWTELADNLSAEELWNELKNLDPEAAENIHMNNQKRVIRALEVIETTGKSITKQQTSSIIDLSSSPYDVLLIGLTTDRKLLYDRINTRVDSMMEVGLLEEANMVYSIRTAQAAQGIGYKEFFPYFDGEIDLEDAVDSVKQQSRRYAKRQLTWFRNRMDAQWWDLVQEPESLNSLLSEIKKWLRS